jgi:hypothetical protein
MAGEEYMRVWWRGKCNSSRKMWRGSSHESSFHIFSLSIDGGNWSASASGCFSCGEEPQYLQNKKLGSPRYSDEEKYYNISGATDNFSYHTLNSSSCSALYFHR